MLTHANIKLFTGRTSNINIVANNQKYQIPSVVYNAALLSPPLNKNEMAHTIDLVIDNHNYTCEESVGLIITFMYDIYTPRLPLQNLQLLNIDNRNLLPMYLSVYSWCNTMLRPSKYHTSYCKTLSDSILLYVNFVRALVCDDDKFIVGSRFDVLAKCGLPISIPTYLDNVIILPQTTHEPLITKLNRCSNAKEYKLKSHNGKLHMARNQYNDICLINNSSEYYENLNYDGQQLLDLQLKVRSDLIRSQMRIMCYEHPEYMKIDNFGNECARCVYDLLPRDALLLYCLSKPKITICDVFQHGLAGALSIE